MQVEEGAGNGRKAEIGRVKTRWGRFVSLRIRKCLLNEKWGGDIIKNQAVVQIAANSSTCDRTLSTETVFSFVT